jgi:ribosomal protein S12 methylthiotransferase accessory factor
MPAAWIGWGANVARTNVYAPWEADRFGFGAALGNDDRARNAALGEAVERYCGNVVAGPFITASYRQLQTAGYTAVDPAEFALYSTQQYATAGFPFVPFTHDLEVEWIQGQDLHTNSDVLIPASLVYLNYYRGIRAELPATNALMYAGIATGGSRSHAERFALEEVMERDASTIWWASGAAADEVTDGDLIVSQLDDPETASRSVRILALPSPFDVPVMAAFIEDAAREIVAFGAACRADPIEAATKAVVEAFGLFGITLQLLNPNSDVWRAIRQGNIGSHIFRRHRADRRYADDFRPDLRDLVDLPAVAQLYLDPRMAGQPLNRLRVFRKRITFGDVPAIADDQARTVYLDRVAAAGLRALSVDLTTPDVAAAGLTVVRVLVTGTYGNAAAAFPYLGGSRLYELPFSRGWIPAPLTEQTLIRHPIPLA